MQLNNLLEKISVLNKTNEDINKGLHLSLSGLSSGEKSLLIHSTKKKCIVVCSDFVLMSELKNSLTMLGHKVGIVNIGISSPIYSYNQDNSSIVEFITNIFDYHYNKTDILLVMSEALLQRLPDKSFLNNIFELKKNGNYNFSNLINTFVKMGYTRSDYANKKGLFSVRGDIVDVFPINSENPFRLDFVGNSLESINSFDGETMKSIKSFDDMCIYSSTLFLGETEEIKKHFFDEVKKIKISNDNYSKVNEIKSAYSKKFESGNLTLNDGFILPFFNFSNNILSIFDNELIFIDEPKRVYDDVESIYKNNIESIYNLIQKGELLPIHSDFFYPKNKIFNVKKYAIFDDYSSNVIPFNKIIKYRSIGARKYTFDYKALVQDISLYLSSSYLVVLCCGSEESVKSIGEYLLNNRMSFKTEIPKEIEKGIVILKDYSLSASFLESSVVIIGTNDLVKKFDKPSNNAKKKSAFFLPKIGDYVVHEIHGIGVCSALERLNLNGNEQDYFIIEYKGGDKLYVPSEQANTITAFLGGDKTPTLNKIGGQEFQKAKERVKNAVKELAVNLVDLYSEREKLKGFKFTGDNYLMDEFENSFAYELTPDQKLAVNDIKKDMYSGKLMDRLICGDVGYGKTEVALRAAYQAVLDGKQVAFLCPTTILSEQHYNTTKSRTKEFMCNVQVLNRFKSKKEQEQILRDLKDGKVDIIIGTHRLLSSDVMFKDLGLLILDEEQRFGVGDKEKIKNIKKDIDVISMSATPIPRTLSMAMTGIRDISIIETPPKNRLPVQTYVAEQSFALLEDACKREMSRNGQVLIIYNRVESIYDFAKKVSEVMPTARLGVAHGQMNEKILSDTIMKLYNGEFDILISTTLIESGIDLPNANTLLVIDADRLGLAQLYQLRGRIGRSDRLAYAYFTYNSNKILTTDAYKRLDSILEFSELGSGFKIAMRDLEIRGAGNVLGKEQHGHMEKVGYELYTKLLEDAVNELKGKKVIESRPMKVDISCPAFLPDDYVVGEEERIKVYSKISDISSNEEFSILSEELKQAFGEIPNVLQNLMKIALIKNMCIKIGAKRILVDNVQTEIYLYKKEEIIDEQTSKVLSENRNIAVLKFEDVPIISLDFKGSVENKLNLIIEFLCECTNNEK